MKKILVFFTVLFFVCALFLNLAFDSKGNFHFFNSAEAKAQLPEHTDPSVWYCTDDNGSVYSYATVCYDDGGDPCVATECPDPPAD